MSGMGWNGSMPYKRPWRIKRGPLMGVIPSLGLCASYASSSIPFRVEYNLVRDKDKPGRNSISCIGILQIKAHFVSQLNEIASQIVS